MFIKILKIIIIVILISYNFGYGRDVNKQNYSGNGYELSLIFGTLKNKQINGMLIFKFNKNKFLKIRDVKDIELMFVRDSDKIILNNYIMTPAVKKFFMLDKSLTFGIENTAKIPFVIELEENDSNLLKLIGNLQFYVCNLSACNLEKIKLKNIVINTEKNKILVDEKIENEIKKLPLNVSADVFKANTKFDTDKKNIILNISDEKIKNIKHAIFSSDDLEFMNDVSISKQDSYYFLTVGVKNFINENKNDINIKVNIDTNIGNFILNDKILIKEQKIENVNLKLNEIYEHNIKDSKFKQIVLLIILCFCPVMLIIYYNRISFLSKLTRESFYINEIMYFSGIIFSITLSQLIIINYFDNFIFFMYYLINKFTYSIVVVFILIILHSVLLKQINNFLFNTNYLKYLVSFIYGFISFICIFLVIIILLQNTFHYFTIDYNLGILQIIMMLMIIFFPYTLFYLLKEKIKDIINSNQIRIFKMFIFFFAYLILLFMIFMVLIGYIYYFMVLLFLFVLSAILFIIKYKIKDSYYQKIMVMIIFLVLLIVSFFEKTFVSVNYRVSESGIIWNKIQNINDIQNKIKEDDGVLILKVTADWCLKCYLMNQVFKDKELNSIIKNDAAMFFEYNVTKEFDIELMYEIKKYNKLGILPFLMVVKKDRTIIFYDNYFKNNLINFLTK